MMKKTLFLLLFFAINICQAQTPESISQQKINALKPKRINQFASGELSGAIESVLNVTLNRVPFLTVAELRAGYGLGAKVVNVINNGKIYTFKYDQSSSEADDGYTVIVQSGKRYVIETDAYTPEMFEAKTDDLTSDLTAIQKAINKAETSSIKRVHFSYGVYIITGSINVPSGVELTGQGVVSEIRSTGSSVYPSIKNSDFVNGNDDITIKDLTVNGYRAERGLSEDAGSHGIRIQSSDANRCRRINIYNVWVKNVPNAGMMFFNIKDSNVNNNKVSDTMRDGITTWFNSEKVSFSNNQMWDIRDDGYGINSEVTGHTGTIAKSITIAGGQISHANDSHFGSGVRVAGAWDVSVSTLNISNIQGHGVLVEGSFLTNSPSRRVNVTGITVNTTGFNVAAGGHGIAVANVIGCNIQTNVIQNYYLNGVNLSAMAKNVNVIGNEIFDGVKVDGVGILVEGEDNNISSNSITLTKSYAIRILGDDNQIIGNKLKECATATPGNAYIILSANVNHTNVQSNKIRRITTTYGSFGIRAATGTGTGNLITGNQTRGFAAGNGVSNGATGTNVVTNNMEVL